MNVSDTEVIRLILNAGPVVRFVLFVLLVFSAACWAIIFTKIVQLRRARHQSTKFIEAFWQSGDLSKAYKSAKKFKDSPVARAYRAAYLELARLLPQSIAKQDGDEARPAPTGFGGRHNVDRALRRAINMETTRLRTVVPFLATTGNTAPFIGLFGTVWGIMNAFHGIGQRGSASLAVVAPGISEALVATAAGLAAAIPAVIAYNHFMTRISNIEAEMRSFADDFMNIVEREFLTGTRRG